MDGLGVVGKFFIVILLILHGSLVVSLIPIRVRWIYVRKRLKNWELFAAFLYFIKLLYRSVVLYIDIVLYKYCIDRDKFIGIKIDIGVKYV